MAVTLSSIGLVSDMIGALLIWKYGLPPRIDPEGHISLILQQTDECQVATARRYMRRSSCGILLLVFGFGLQLISNYL